MTRAEVKKICDKFLSEGVPFALTKNGVIGFTPEHIRQYDFKLEEILWALSRKRRYNDHCDWTVLRHSILCYELAKGYKVEALVHDFHEAYTGDLNCFLKKKAPKIREIETIVQDAILRDIFTLYSGGFCDSEIKRVDTLAAQLEMSYFFKWDSRIQKPVTGDYELFHEVRRRTKDECIKFAFDILY